MEEVARKEKPKLIICGASSYSREWDYERFRKVADEIGAVLMCDMAHPAGLIAAGLLKNPLEYCHFVTTTTHKTLRGPRGGMILIGKDGENIIGEVTAKGTLKKLSTILDSAVFPGTQGGPLMHVIAAKGVAFGEALDPSFKIYGQQVIKNASALANAMVERGYKIISGGTDNHLMLIDLRPKNVTGKLAENLLGVADITVNKNMVPFDTESPMVTSGIRLGTAAITSRGLTESHMVQIANWIDTVIVNPNDNEIHLSVRKEIHELMKNFPLVY